MEYERLVATVRSSLVPDVFWYIVDLAREYHINAGRKEWKKRMEKINEEYKFAYGWGVDRRSQEKIKGMYKYLVKFAGKEPDEFGHDYSCRCFNHRDLANSLLARDYEYFRERKCHFPPLMLLTV